ncbi:helix-turn-helix domain-containing protein [Rossellomorea oryzaecorticis]|uniref:Helix-turn-helix domain-containing protein n=1 Tax=Rossellomorea oryzaecorticis TaxID=1396505 RepID=A0ABW8VUK1_9BACI
MDYSAIGKKVRELRKAVGLTQGELAEGICTQALVSRIEKGDIYPSATALYQISVKLGVDVNYFFEIGTTPRLDYVLEVEKQLKRLRVNFKFDEIRELVKVEEKNPLFYKDNEKLQLLYWYKGIYAFEVEKDQGAAFAILDEAYNLTANQKKAMTEREMEILLCIGTFHSSLHEHAKAMDYYTQIESALKATEQLHDKTIKPRLFYNISRVLTRIGSYNESTGYCRKALNWCIQEELLWGIGELNYQIGYNFELVNDLEKALPYFKRALHMFELRQSEKNFVFLQKKISHINNELEMNP